MGDFSYVKSKVRRYALDYDLLHAYSDDVSLK